MDTVHLNIAIIGMGLVKINTPALVKKIILTKLALPITLLGEDIHHLIFEAKECKNWVRLLTK